MLTFRTYNVKKNKNNFPNSVFDFRAESHLYISIKYYYISWLSLGQFHSIWCIFKLHIMNHTLFSHSCNKASIHTFIFLFLEDNIQSCTESSQSHLLHTFDSIRFSPTLSDFIQVIMIFQEMYSQFNFLSFSSLQIIVNDAPNSSFRSIGIRVSHS